MPTEGTASRPDIFDLSTPGQLPGDEAPLPCLPDTTVPTPAVPCFELEPVAVPTVPEVSTASVGPGEAAWVSLQSPAKSSGNEDSVTAISVSERKGLLAVADGLGGHRGGRRASRMMISSLEQAAERFRPVSPAAPLMISRTVPIPTQSADDHSDQIDTRAILLDHVERVNRRLIRSGTGAGTTLVMVEIDGLRGRTYHIGDSQVLIVSQRGRVKYQTVCHSPVGYAVEAGILSEEEALLHEDRHLVSNVVGSPEMSVQLGPWVPLAPRDTILLASDGLFDNLMQSEVIDVIRKGPLEDRVRQLAARALERMVSHTLDQPCKPDDLTILAFRRSRDKMSRRALAES